jgi:hypothetical protein
MNGGRSIARIVSSSVIPGRAGGANPESILRSRSTLAHVATFLPGIWIPGSPAPRMTHEGRAASPLLFARPGEADVPFSVSPKRGNGAPGGARGLRHLSWAGPLRSAPSSPHLTRAREERIEWSRLVFFRCKAILSQPLYVAQRSSAALRTNTAPGAGMMRLVEAS